ncbi:hypothetical protein OMR07_23745 [Methylobacterium organophilum]|nr:hypothetical protein [Methylobacterium organophilum]
MNNSAPRQMSVQTKINLALVLVLVAIMSASLFFSASTEKRLVLQVVEQQTKDAADSYFDSINTMMLTGTMAQREVLRNKILARQLGDRIDLLSTGHREAEMAVVVRSQRAIRAARHDHEDELALLAGLRHPDRRLRWR